VHVIKQIFNTDPAFLPCLEDRFDMLNLANNHVMDQRDLGFKDTIKNIEDRFQYIGVGSNKTKAWGAKFLRGTDKNVALIAATTYLAGCHIGS
jgi:hypothetical protein